MSYTILDLELFADIERRLKAVTPANLEELKPGDLIPENVVMLGKMSPSLKALLWVRNQATMAAHAEYDATLASIGKPSTLDDLAKCHEAEARLRAVRDRWGRLYGMALRAEFPQAKDSPIHYGPDFEAYQYTEPEGISLQTRLLAG